MDEEGREREREGERKRKRKKKTDAGGALSVPQSILPCTRAQKINALSNFINSSLHNEPRGERITFLNAAIMPPRTSAL